MERLIGSGPAAGALPDEGPPVGPGAGPGARGHVVVAVDADTTGTRSAAVWHVTCDGALSGAWVFPYPDGLDVDSARLLLLLAERRALVGFRVDEALGHLQRAADVLGTVLPRAFADGALDLAVLSEETTTARRKLAEAVIERGRNTGSKLQQLDWSARIPDTFPANPITTLETLGLAVPDGPPVVVKALGSARALRWHIRAWQETESVRVRRKYLHPYGGPEARPLPPNWAARITAVHAVPFELP